MFLLVLLKIHACSATFVLNGRRHRGATHVAASATTPVIVAPTGAKVATAATTTLVATFKIITTPVVVAVVGPLSVEARVATEVTRALLVETSDRVLLVQIGLGRLGLLILSCIVGASLVLEVLDTPTHNSILMLVLDVLHDEVNGLEGLVTEHADVLLVFYDRPGLLKAVLVVFLDQVPVLFWILRHLFWALGQDLLSRRNIVGFERPG